MIKAYLYPVIALALSITTAEEPVTLPDLKIERSDNAVHPFFNRLIQETKQDNGMIKAVFSVMPKFFTRYPHFAGGEVVDPFAPAGEKKPKPPQEFFEAHGISFPPGTSADFDPDSKRLTVTQSAEEYSKIQTLIDNTYYRPVYSVALRAEIYELPAPQALKVVNSAASFGIHNPERDALVSLVKRGDVQLVSAISTIGQSGTIATVKDTQQIQVFAGWEENGSPKYDTQIFGTILKVDPVLGADYLTIDLNLELEHDTAPPEMIEKVVTSPKTGQQLPVSIPAFHRQKITTQLSLTDGDYVLIGNWKPTGDDKYSEKNLVHLIFIHAHVRPSYDRIRYLYQDPPRPRSSHGLPR